MEDGLSLEVAREVSVSVLKLVGVEGRRGGVLGRRGGLAEGRHGGDGRCFGAALANRSPVRRPPVYQPPPADPSQSPHSSPSVLRRLRPVRSGCTPPECALSPAISPK